jgi:hypothetical protein
MVASFGRVWVSDHPMREANIHPSEHQEKREDRGAGTINPRRAILIENRPRN